MSKRSTAVRIGGKEYRIKSDGDDASLQRVAGYVDETRRGSASAPAPSIRSRSRC